MLCYVMLSWFFGSLHALRQTNRNQYLQRGKLFKRFLQNSNLYLGSLAPCTHLGRQTGKRELAALSSVCSSSLFLISTNILNAEKLFKQLLQKASKYFNNKYIRKLYIRMIHISLAFISPFA